MKTTKNTTLSEQSQNPQSISEKEIKSIPLMLWYRHRKEDVTFIN
jgi:hypothetical protein